jgi:hypothetical protein
VGQTAREARSGVVGAGMPPRSAPGVDSNVDSNVDSPKKSGTVSETSLGSTSPAHRRYRAGCTGPCNVAVNLVSTRVDPLSTLPGLLTGPPPPAPAAPIRSRAPIDRRRVVGGRPLLGLARSAPSLALQAQVVSTAEPTAWLPAGAGSSGSRTTSFGGDRRQCHHRRAGVAPRGVRHFTKSSGRCRPQTVCGPAPSVLARRTGRRLLGATWSCHGPTEPRRPGLPLGTTNALSETHRSIATLNAGAGSLWGGIRRSVRDDYGCAYECHVMEGCATLEIWMPRL